jgi:hypothetical protein
MKRSLFLSLIFLSALSFAAPLSIAQKPDKPALATNHMKPSKSSPAKLSPALPPHSSLSMIELTNAEMYRYGREMYLRENFTEAAKVFLQMLRVDCSNKLAQYHLRKIATQAPSLAFLNDKLDKLPCKAYDFSKEDFLPASVYYEKDPSLMLEQLISYSTRHRITEKEMAEKIDTYTAMVKDLENTVDMLKHDASQREAMTSLGTVSPDTLERIEAGTRSANKIEKEISVLKNQLASERLDRQKEVQDMRTRLAEAEADLTSEEQPQSPSSGTRMESPQTSVAETDYSGNAKALVDAVAQAKIELAGKEQNLAEKDQTLLTLQARFDAIQRRLKVIQNDLAKKNAQIQALQTNLQDTEKP